MGRKTSIKPNEFDSYREERDYNHTIILYNDDFNLYEFVIDSLVEICSHNRLQAEQCTLIAHHKGKCDVKNGSLAELKPIKDELLRRGLSATIASKN